MNTDNTLISGETIDYGPCAMMNQFDFDTVFSSIDKQGRYAFGNQPNMASWNCARLAESLIALISDDDEQAVAMMTPLIEGFSTQFNQQFSAMWAQKLGLTIADDKDNELVGELLGLLKQHQLDYTNTFNALTESLNGQAEIPLALTSWAQQWQTRTNEHSYQVMRQANPSVIPRNHIIEDIITQYTTHGDSELLSRFSKVMSSPYTSHAQATEFQTPPEDDKNYRTFCGT